MEIVFYGQFIRGKRPVWAFAHKSARRFTGETLQTFDRAAADAMALWSITGPVRYELVRGPRDDGAFSAEEWRAVCIVIARGDSPHIRCRRCHRLDTKLTKVEREVRHLQNAFDAALDNVRRAGRFTL